MQAHERPTVQNEPLSFAVDRHPAASRGVGEAAGRTRAAYSHPLTRRGRLRVLWRRSRIRPLLRKTENDEHLRPQKTSQISLQLPFQGKRKKGGGWAPERLASAFITAALFPSSILLIRCHRGRSFTRISRPFVTPTYWARDISQHPTPTPPFPFFLLMSARSTTRSTAPLLLDQQTLQHWSPKRRCQGNQSV